MRQNATAYRQLVQPASKPAIGPRGPKRLRLLTRRQARLSVEGGGLDALHLVFPHLIKANVATSVIVPSSAARWHGLTGGLVQRQGLGSPSLDLRADQTGPGHHLSLRPIICRFFWSR